MTDRERELTGLQLVQLCNKLYAEKADLTMKVEGLEADLSVAADALAGAISHSENLLASLEEVAYERSELIKFLGVIGARVSFKLASEKPAVDDSMWG
jgi:hypothetical protein